MEFRVVLIIDNWKLGFHPSGTIRMCSQGLISVVLVV